MRPTATPPTLALAAVLALAAGLAATPARVEERAAGPVDLGVGAGSTLSYKLIHKFHEVTGTARAVDGKARLQPGGGVQVMVRARVDAFDSGNGNRDAHMQEVTEAARYPQVILKAVGAITPPASYPAEIEVALQGELTFHGLSRPVAVPARVTFTAPDAARVAASFPISLDGFGVERPSLLFVKVDDAVVITANLNLATVQP
jgi:polyisoprenoid-binding protein YceI